MLQKDFVILKLSFTVPTPWFEDKDLGSLLFTHFGGWMFGFTCLSGRERRNGYGAECDGETMLRN